MNDAYDLALRVGRAAAREYVGERRIVASEKQDELLGAYVIGLESALTSIVEGWDEALPDIVEAAIEAFVKEADHWPAPGKDPERLFDFDSLLA